MRRKGDREQAFRDYKKGLTHRENAEKQGVSVNTVKSWCRRYKWKERLKQENSIHLFMKRLYQDTGTYGEIKDFPKKD